MKPEDALELYESILDFVNLHNSHMIAPAEDFQEITGGDHELNALRNTILKLLEQKGPQSMRQIADFVNMLPTNATKLINELVNYGYVVRSHGNEDRRKVLISLTDKGTEYMERLRLINIQFISNQMDKVFSEEEQRELLGGYKKVTGMLKKFEQQPNE